ncbi:Uncharacterized protein TCM_033338 [Theobroma cacao]|uniref:Uncharacterized protein n=1 Tax=Theobroma cacao TaxID=3641 RepID=A0A061F9R7_THECC|nr:Uncharacterized protein TCM_033338 [Theobroma cacao]
MMLNFLMRIDGKLTDQAKQIVKIEAKLKQLEALLNSTKETKVPEAPTSTASQSRERTTTKQFETAASGHDRETEKEIPKNPNVNQAENENSEKKKVEQKEHEEEKEKEHSIIEKSVVSSLGKSEEILVSNFNRDILEKAKVDQGQQQAKIQQKVQSVPQGIKEGIREAHLNKSKTVVEDTAPIAKRTVGKGRKTMAIETKTFRRRKSIRLALTSTQ